MELATLFEKLGIALGLGLLVGLQRERVESQLAGFRTFPLVTLLGTVTGFLAQEWGGWVLAAAFLGLTGLVAAGNVMLSHTEAPDPGQTTEVALLLMFAVGAFLVFGPVEVAVALGGGTAVLLYLKPQLQSLAGRIGDRDFRAIIQFVLVSLVILPVLPDRTFGPFQVLNPRQIWWMVVLIVAISLGGYLAYKLAGQRTGTALAGVLGGLVSSTATTVSYARKSEQGFAPGPAAVVILLASTVVYGRILVEIGVVAPGSFTAMAPPLAAMLALALALAAVLWWVGHDDEAEIPEPENPTELRSALVFGFLYAAVLLAVAAAKEHWAGAGLWVVSVLSGLTDVDAITLSTSRLIEEGRLEAGLGWRLILVASLSNLVFKGGVVMVLGTRALSRWVAAVFGGLLVAGTSLVVLWP